MKITKIRLPDVLKPQSKNNPQLESKITNSNDALVKSSSLSKKGHLKEKENSIMQIISQEQSSELLPNI